MPQEVTEFVYWDETLAVKPNARECWTFCLEAEEILAVSLSATCPIDATLADWPSYREWEAARFDGMPHGRHFVNDSRSVSWEETAFDTPYMLVLVVANASEQTSHVSVRAAVRRSVPSREEWNRRDGGPAPGLRQAKWRG
jgi:hypothetical protein